jgi:hypothetical protein
MKQYYIEINKDQPLRLIESRLKKLGFVSAERWNKDMRKRSSVKNKVFTFSDGSYSIHYDVSPIEGHKLITLEKICETYTKNTN